MIVRVLYEGQFEIDGDDLDALNEVDNQIVEAVAAGDEGRFRSLMERMHEIVCGQGRPLAADVLKESDIILPAPDSTMDEVRELFAGEGMIPG